VGAILDIFPKSHERLLLAVLADISIIMEFMIDVSTELRSPEANGDLQKEVENDDKIMKDIEQ
jgi:hypothetical protein